MSGPYVEQTAEPGEAPVTDKMIERAVDSMYRHIRVNGGSYTWYGLAQAALEAVVPDIAAALATEGAALVAAAEERGRVEGAAKAYRHIASEARLDGRLNPQWLENMARHAETGTRPGDSFPTDDTRETAAEQRGAAKERGRITAAIEAERERVRNNGIGQYNQHEKIGLFTATRIARGSREANDSVERGAET